jgi:hypothetical protein
VRVSENDNQERERVSEHARTYSATAFGRLANATRTMPPLDDSEYARFPHGGGSNWIARILLCRDTVLRFHDNEAHDEEFY